jgi:hypothetical protein
MAANAFSPQFSVSEQLELRNLEVLKYPESHHPLQLNTNN